MLGVSSQSLYTDEDMQAIRQRVDAILARIDERSRQISGMVEAEKEVAALTQKDLADEPAADGAQPEVEPEGDSQ